MSVKQPTAAWHAHMLDPSLPAALCVAQGKPAQVCTARTLHDVMPTLDQAETWAQQGLWVVGGLVYEAAPAFDPAFTVQAAGYAGPLAVFHAYEADQVHTLSLTELLDPARPIKTTPWCNVQRTDAFNAAFSAAREAIAAGEFYQINLTTRLTAAAPADSPWNLFLQLFNAQPAANSLFLEHADGAVLSLSPELFFRWEQGRLTTSPMKGTRATAAQSHLSAWKDGRLSDSSKDRAENVMIVDLLRNDLARVCLPRSVQVQSLFDILVLPTVEQMTSTIIGQTRADCPLRAVFSALFPCGSVTGAPKAQAMKRIAEWEPAPRGFYCGALGVLAPGGAAHFNVPIRTVQWNPVVAPSGANGELGLVYGVGSGITWYSNAQSEHREWWEKTVFLRQSTCEVQILETVALSHGHWAREHLHIERMRQSAVHFGYVWDPLEVHQVLATAAQQHASGQWRGRWLLSPEGRLTVQCDAMPATPDSVVLRLADSPFEAQADFVMHKTTHRPHYDHAFAQANGAFDVLLWNAEGLLLETCRCNIVLDLDGTLFTPANKPGSNLLAGVLRQALLQHNTIHEMSLRKNDLQRARAVWLINSLRGWIPVREVVGQGVAISYPTIAVPTSVQ
ncbi:chorismate-binding protein [Limnobacter humi]|uniref:Chorismate-binding protein n=1 Tax=Limnobacter humi TaxID=1778671 RepID=A0ABT1WH67_9BURK|nr:chorismate-binding protein [Limnobacter humi]MCQ8896867.1 chorismate-binding protein [Limnobacter humi]